MGHTTELIKSVATNVRYWAESRAEGTANSSDLNCWCAIATAELFRQLRQENELIEPVICMSNGMWGSHVWLMVDDTVIDITATQFSEFKHNPVLIVHEREVQHLEYYARDEVFYSPVELIRFQKKNRWPLDQIAFAR